MKNSKLKSLIVLLLVFVMVFSVIPVSAGSVSYTLGKSNQSVSLQAGITVNISFGTNMWVVYSITNNGLSYSSGDKLSPKINLNTHGGDKFIINYSVYSTKPVASMSSGGYKYSYKKDKYIGSYYWIGTCACSHSSTVFFYQTQGTCVKQGVIVKKCSSCGETLKENTGYGEHSWNPGLITTAATCTQSGIRTYTCYYCNKTKTETISAKGHRWSYGSITKTATCQQTGIRTYTCYNCGQTKTETIPTTDHRWSYGSITKNATCKDVGVRTYTCYNCGTTKTETIAKTAHSWDYGKITKNATCKETGIKTFTCYNCGQIKNETLPKTDHVFDTTKTYTTASCEKAGVNYTVCKYCGEHSNGTTQQALGHDFTGKSRTNSDGSVSYKCVRCDKYGGTVKVNEIDKKLLEIPDAKCVKRDDRPILVFLKNKTVKDILSLFNDCEIVDVNNKAVTEKTDNLVTGMKIVIGNQTVEIAIAGDVDSSGDVSVSDARLALRGAVKLEKLQGSKFVAANVDGEDGISVSDARLILRKAVKLSASFVYTSDWQPKMEAVEESSIEETTTEEPTTEEPTTQESVIEEATSEKDNYLNAKQKLVNYIKNNGTLSKNSDGYNCYDCYIVELNKNYIGESVSDDSVLFSTALRYNSELDAIMACTIATASTENNVKTTCVASFFIDGYNDLIYSDKTVGVGWTSQSKDYYAKIDKESYEYLQAISFTNLSDEDEETETSARKEIATNLLSFSLEQIDGLLISLDASISDFGYTAFVYDNK